MTLRLAFHFAVIWFVGLLACSAQDASVDNNSHATAKTPWGTVNGRVYCADTNLPARLAQVSLDAYSTDTSGHVLHTGKVAITDLDGRFSIAGVSEGTYVISIHLTGYMDLSPDLLHDPSSKMTPEARKELESLLTEVSISANQTVSLTLRLERGAEIFGTVQYDDGSPAIGLPVTFTTKSEKAVEGDVPPTFFPTAIQGMVQRTDDHGHFRIRGLSPGDYQVKVIVPTVSSAESSEDRASEVSQMFDYTSGALNVYDDGTLQRSKSKGIQIRSGEKVRDLGR